MKARNIITIISVIFALVSCSAESDILNDMNQPSVKASAEGVISCSINNLTTKAGNINTGFEMPVQLNDKEAKSDICSFYTFANEDQFQPTTLVLNFEADGIKRTKEFTIKYSANDNIVKSDYLYRPNVTVNVYRKNVKPEVTFTVADWKISQVAGERTEANKQSSI